MVGVAWKGNAESSICENVSCRRKFTMVARRHHCRHCGGLFCGECTKRRVRDQRVCSGCYGRVHRTQPNGFETYLSLVLCRLAGDKLEMEEAGFSVVHHEPVSKHGCQWSLVTNDHAPGVLFLAFSSPKRLFDCVLHNDSLDIETLNGARVHSGFYTLVQNGLKNLSSVLQSSNAVKREVIFTGYSLGGALASIALLELLSMGFVIKAQAITFGSPLFIHADPTTSRPQLPRSVSNARLMNFVCNFDVVPRLLCLDKSAFDAFIRASSDAVKLPKPQKNVAALEEGLGLADFCSRFNSKGAHIKSAMHHGYLPLGTFVFFQVLTDLPSTSYRLSCGVTEPDVRSACWNRDAGKLLKSLPVDDKICGKSFADIFASRAVADHGFELYYAAVRHLSLTGWGCAPQVGRICVTPARPTSIQPNQIVNASRRAVILSFDTQCNSPVVVESGDVVDLTAIRRANNKDGGSNASSSQNDDNTSIEERANQASQTKRNSVSSTTCAGGREGTSRASSPTSGTCSGKIKLALDGVGVSNCLVLREGIDEITMVDLYTRLQQQSAKSVVPRNKTRPRTRAGSSGETTRSSFSRDESYELQVVEPEPLASPALVGGCFTKGPTFLSCASCCSATRYSALDTPEANPVAYQITQTHLIVVYHNASREAFSIPISRIDTVTTPVPTSVEWPRKVGFAGGAVIVRCTFAENSPHRWHEYYKLAFREPDDGIQFYKTLKLQSNESVDANVMRLVQEDAADGSTHGISAETRSMSSTSGIDLSVELEPNSRTSWVLEVSSLLGCVLFKLDADASTMSVEVDEEDNVSRAQSQATAHYWLALHNLSHRLSTIEDTLVWRAELPDSAHPPRMEDLGK
ncbi:hypothetical protein DIPPA_62404 [Diplonema papillatum]|nr:hypothetical protein DIPPA_62404 [Diplonema papillatum]